MTMNKVTLTNDLLQLEADSHGATLHSVVYRPTGSQLVWNGAPDAWKFRDVVMFPVIGRWDYYTVNGDRYATDMGHGVVRTQHFDVQLQEDKVVFTTRYDQETLRQYPFKFQLQVTMTLQSDGWTTDYTVTNLDERDIPYYIGAHPGFVTTGGDVLKFEPQTLKLFPLDGKGRVSGDARQFAVDEIQVDKQLFARYNTVVMPRPSGDKVTLVRGDGLSVTVYYGDCSTLAVWSNSQCGQFVCIEPWWGICEVADSSSELSEKPFVNILSKGESRTYTLKYVVKGE